MSDQVISDLLHEVVDGVEPGERLEAVRAATERSRNARRWWWAGGGVLAAASVVVALALSTGSTSPVSTPASAGPAMPTPTSSPTPSEGLMTPSSAGSDATAVAVYYVGDTPRGPRLYREIRGLGGEPLTAAVSAAVGRDDDDRRLYPLDPDYRVVWPPLTAAEARLAADGASIEVTLGGDPEGDLRQRGTLSRLEARLAIEAVVRTAQEVVGDALPVRLMIAGEPSDRVLGISASQPLVASSDLDVLAHVSLSDPSHGLLVDNDDPFTVRGLANSFEGNVVTRIQRREGTEVVEEQPTIAGWAEDRLFPFHVTFDLTDVPPGDYEVLSRTDDPSGEGRFDTDTRVITIVD